MQFDWNTFTYDEEWLRQAAQIEDEAGCDICAGYDDLQGYYEDNSQACFLSKGLL